MANYNKWPKEDLIKRLKKLEAQLQAQTQGEALNGTEAAESTLPPQASQAQNESKIPSQAASEPAPKKQKKSNTMDPSKYGTRLIALKFAYLGKRYNGFEYQSDGALSTIEEELWKALVKACLVFPNPDRPNEVDWNVCEYSKCGRTDRGVSAFGQVVALRVRSNKPGKNRKQHDTDPGASSAEGQPAESSGNQVAKDVTMAGGMEPAPPPEQEEAEEDDDTPCPVEKELQYCRILNRLLPPDIRVYAWCPNPPQNFSARFNCRERQYRYFFTQPAFAPLPNFLEPTTTTAAMPKSGWLDIDAMRKAAKLFEGLHDFRNFCKIDPSKQITNFMRRIHEADIVEVDGVNSAIPYLNSSQFSDARITSTGGPHPKVYYFHVRGSAFLWHQIRCMVSILFLVGQGLESPSIITELLDVEKHPRRPKFVLADDAPLVLWDCIFGRDSADGAADEMDWVYTGSGSGSAPLNLHGATGLAGDLWATWRERKMDEILANRLVDWIAQKTAMDREPDEEMRKETPESKKAARTTRIFEGGDRPKLAGSYVPVWKKELLAEPQVQNDKYAQRKGFESSAAMKAVGNWREVIRAAKESEAMNISED